MSLSPTYWGWSSSSGLYYKHVMIVSYASSGINKLKPSLNDDARAAIYDQHMFIVQATGSQTVGSFREPSGRLAIQTI
jgi:hypothetical protein